MSLTIAVLVVLVLVGLIVLVRAIRPDSGVRVRGWGVEMEAWRGSSRENGATGSELQKAEHREKDDAPDVQLPATSGRPARRSGARSAEARPSRLSR